METAVRDENYALAPGAVKRNQGAAGIDRMRTDQLESHLEANGWLKGTYVPSPGRGVAIPKPSGACGGWASRRYRTGSYSDCWCKRCRGSWVRT